MIGWLKRAGLAAALAAGLASAAAAQDEAKSQRFGDDLYAAGDEVRVAEPGLEDVYAAGGTVTLGAAVRESAHLAGRRVRLTQAAGRDVYAMGQEVEIRGAVAGDVVAMGETVEVGDGGSVGQDLLLAGQSVEVSGPVGGDATLMGGTVTIAGPITGSVQIRAETIRFGPGARIDGTLAYWSSSRVEVPASVIPPERVTGKLVTRKDRNRGPDAFERPERFLAGVVMMLVLGAILAALLPVPLARARDELAARPWLTLLFGFLLTAALFGSVLVLIATIVGIPLAILALVLIPVACVVGYLTAAFIVGRFALDLAKVRRLEGRLGAVAVIATGVVLLSILRIVPFLGWLVLILAVIAGLGAWFMLFVQPRRAAAA